MLPEWWIQNGLTVAFYVAVVLLLIIYRKKFEFQGIAALRKTTFGIAWMKRFSAKHTEGLKILGYCGIGIGFAGMLFIFGYVLKTLYDFFVMPTGPAAFSLVLPGVNIPGSPLTIPLWVLIPLFIVVVIHEGGHGLIAKAFGVPIKTTGLVFFGPLAGAFVEPDEKKLDKQPDVTRFAVFAAGPFFNILTALVVVGILFAVVNPLTTAMLEPVGFSFSQVQEDYPAALAGVQPATIYTTINGELVDSSEELLNALSYTRPGEELVIANEDVSYTVVLGEHPDGSPKGYLGVLGAATDYDVKEGVPKWAYYGLRGIYQFLFWIFALSLGLGAFNLLPLGPVDGGQMIRLTLTKLFGDKRGMLYWARLGWFLFLTILILVFGPIIMHSI